MMGALHHHVRSDVSHDVTAEAQDFCAGDIVRVTEGGLNGGAQGTVLDPNPRHPGWVRVHLTGGPELYFRPERLRLHRRRFRLSLNIGARS